MRLIKILNLNHYNAYSFIRFKVFTKDWSEIIEVTFNPIYEEVNDILASYDAEVL